MPVGGNESDKDKFLWEGAPVLSRDFHDLGLVLGRVAVAKVPAGTTAIPAALPEAALEAQRARFEGKGGAANI